METKPKKPAISKEKIQEFVGRIITDDKFRTRVFENPKSAAEEMGMKLDDNQVEIFKSVSPKILQAMELHKGSEVGVWVLIPIADVGVAGGTYAVGRIDDDFVDKINPLSKKS